MQVTNLDGPIATGRDYILVVEVHNINSCPMANQYPSATNRNERTQNKTTKTQVKMVTVQASNKTRQKRDFCQGTANPFPRRLVKIRKIKKEKDDRARGIKI